MEYLTPRLIIKLFSLPLQIAKKKKKKETYAHSANNYILSKTQVKPNSIHRDRQKKCLFVFNDTFTRIYIVFYLVNALKSLSR